MTLVGNRLLFTGSPNVKSNVGEYIPGSGVNPTSTSVRRALKRRAGLKYDNVRKISYNPCCIFFSR